jgi:LDH2 family malate/lactate/ureidoglycolate dehydrogenase
VSAPAPIDHAALAKFVATVFEANGVPRDDAALIADSLVQADLWGHQSHGVLRTAWYATRLKSGALKPITAPAPIVDAGAVAVFDGGDGIGQVLATRAMQDAIGRARRHGIGAVAVRSSNHFGTAMYYTRMAASAQCIGFCSTNGSPAMAPWGGRRKAVGNNPWSIAAPAGRRPPMVLDIANTSVARGKIYLARNRGQPIPLGWAIDTAGHPTTDPQAALAGNVLPMGGHKGYAISVMMDVLSGVLSGSKFLTGVHGPYEADKKSGCGHLFIAINIAAFRPLAEFEADVEKMIAELKSVPVADGADTIYYPGEIEALNDARHRRDGLTLAPETISDLDKLARETGLEAALPWSQ